VKFTGETQQRAVEARRLFNTLTVQQTKRKLSHLGGIKPLRQLSWQESPLLRVRRMRQQTFGTLAFRTWPSGGGVVSVIRKIVQLFNRY
jgi:hypothetical protein